MKVDVHVEHYTRLTECASRDICLAVQETEHCLSQLVLRSRPGTMFTYEVQSFMRGCIKLKNPVIKQNKNKANKRTLKNKGEML